MVYDGVGKDTYDASLKSAGLEGSVVFFGNASGKVGVCPNILPSSLPSATQCLSRIVRLH